MRMRAVVAELPGLSVDLPSCAAKPRNPRPPITDGGIGSLPNVDAELPENGKVVLDVLGFGKIADRARAVGQGRREGGALGDRLVARRTPNDLSRLVTSKPMVTESSPGALHRRRPAPIRM